PRGITYDTFSDSIYISDTYHHQVQKFSRDGVFIDKFGTFGTGNGNFNTPIGLTTDVDGKIYVVDGENHRVEVFNSNGTFSFKFGGTTPGNYYFEFPQDVDVLSN